MVHGGAVHARWIDRAYARGVANVSGGGPVTIFTPNAKLGGFDRIVTGEMYWSGRVAGEAAQDCGFRIK
jgi:hypothetical protein